MIDAQTAARSPAVRSAVTNGSKALAGVDGRSATARRYRDLIADFANELGGTNQLTTAEQGLLRQAATLTLRAEQLAAAVVRGEAVDGDELIRLSGEARRILTSLRKRAGASPTTHIPLRDQLAAEAAAEAAGEAA